MSRRASQQQRIETHTRKQNAKSRNQSASRSRKRKNAKAKAKLEALGYKMQNEEIDENYQLRLAELEDKFESEQKEFQRLTKFEAAKLEMQKLAEEMERLENGEIEWEN